MRSQPLTGTNFLLIVCIVALTLAAVSHWRYSFYVLLRLLICASSAFLASRQYAKGKRAWAWVFGAVAVLYNPVLPVRMARSDWQLINILTAIFFGGWLIVTTMNRSKARRGDDKE